MNKLAPLLLLALAGCSQMTGSGADYGRDEAIAGAGFRAEAFEVYAKLNPVCPYTADANQLARYAEPAERFQKLRDWVADTPFTVDLAIVEGRFQHFWSVNTAECGPTDTEEGMAAFNAELEDLNRRLSVLEKMAGMI